MVTHFVTLCAARGPGCGALYRSTAPGAVRRRPQLAA
jgi:hypothetical protein